MEIHFSLAVKDSFFQKVSRPVMFNPFTPAKFNLIICIDQNIGKS